MSDEFRNSALCRIGLPPDTLGHPAKQIHFWLLTGGDGSGQLGRGEPNAGAPGTDSAFAEGLLVVSHFRRGYVASCSMQDFQEIKPLQLVRELFAAARAAKALIKGEIIQLELIHEQLEKLYTELGYQRSKEHLDLRSGKVDQYIAKAAGSPQLNYLIKNSSALSAVHVSKYFKKKEAHGSYKLAASRNHRSACPEQLLTGRSKDARTLGLTSAAHRFTRTREYSWLISSAMLGM